MKKMSYMWQDKIFDVRYSNQEMNAVLILWGDDKDDLREHHLAVDMEDQQFRDLLKYVTWDEIEKRTQLANEVRRQEFRDAFNDYAKRSNAYVTEESEQKIGSLDLLFEFDESNEIHKEQLFKLKLRMFEEEFVKNSKSKTAKAEVRKAKTPVQAIKAFSKFKK